MDDSGYVIKNTYKKLYNLPDTPAEPDASDVDADEIHIDYGALNMWSSLSNTEFMHKLNHIMRTSRSFRVLGETSSFGVIVVVELYDGSQYVEYAIKFGLYLPDEQHGHAEQTFRKRIQPVRFFHNEVKIQKQLYSKSTESYISVCPDVLGEVLFSFQQSQHILSELNEVRGSITPIFQDLSMIPNCRLGVICMPFMRKFVTLDEYAQKGTREEVNLACRTTIVSLLIMLSTGILHCDGHAGNIMISNTEFSMFSIFIDFGLSVEYNTLISDVRFLKRYKEWFGEHEYRVLMSESIETLFDQILKGTPSVYLEACRKLIFRYILVENASRETLRDFPKILGILRHGGIFKRHISNESFWQDIVSPDIFDIGCLGLIVHSFRDLHRRDSTETLPTKTSSIARERFSRCEEDGTGCLIMGGRRRRRLKKGKKKTKRCRKRKYKKTMKKQWNISNQNFAKLSRP
jgi:hypothetical protein